MSEILLGRDQQTDEVISFPSDYLARHLHLVGATGSGKTTAIVRIIRQILTSLNSNIGMFVLDPMGNLSQDLLRWFANTRVCPDYVRDRLLYIEPAREDVVLPFNPLLYQSPAHLYFQVERAVTLILRAWASQELDAMPRLRKWTFNAFHALAMLSLPISVCRYLLQPGSQEHNALLQLLPGELKTEWQEILRSRGSDAIRILESSKNRLDPYFHNVILRRMFGSRKNLFDVARFIRERRIVICNLAGYQRIPQHVSSTIGALVLNEILMTAANLPRDVVNPTYVLLDEFQMYVSADIYDAIPIVRQQGLRLILSHQSLSQLEVGDVDLSGLIWQPRNRLMFTCDADDADQLAHELASLNFDPLKIKHQLFARRQKIVGYRREWLASRSESQGTTDGWQRSQGTGRNSSQQVTRQPDGHDTSRGLGMGSSRSDSQGTSGGSSSNWSQGGHESLLPIHEDVEELSKLTFSSFEEEAHAWGRMLRSLPTGQALAKFYNDPRIRHVLIDEHPIPNSSALRLAVEELKQRNFASDIFVSAAALDQEAEQIRLSLFQTRPIILTEFPSPGQSLIASDPAGAGDSIAPLSRLVIPPPEPLSPPDASGLE